MIFPPSIPERIFERVGNDTRTSKAKQTSSKARQYQERPEKGSAASESEYFFAEVYVTLQASPITISMSLS